MSRTQRHNNKLHSQKTDIYVLKPQFPKEYFCMVVKIIRYTLNDMKCGAGERWIDSARNEVLHKAKEGRNILHTI